MDVDLPLKLKTRQCPTLTQEDVDRLTVQAEAVSEAYRERSADNFLLFARGLRIHSELGSRIFARCEAPFQTECFKALAQPLHDVRDGKRPRMRRFWIERTKKASKDADLAIIVVWLVAYANRPFYGQIGANDRYQAAIIKERVSTLLEYNPWLKDRIEIVQNQIRSTAKRIDGRAPMARFDVLAADASGAHGGTPDLLIINELTHITKFEFAETLMDNADGVPNGIVIIATNAGIRGTPQETWRKRAIESKGWLTFILAEPAPWHDPSTIAEAERRNSPSRFARLWKGRWVSGKGDAFDEDDVEAMFVLKTATPPEDGWLYYGGMDLGITQDRSGVVILGVNPAQRRIKTVWWKRWDPHPQTHKIDLEDIEHTVVKLSNIYALRNFAYDPTEARLMAQRLARSMPMHEMNFSSPKNLNLMAETLVAVVKDRMLECYDDEEGTLRRDFGKMSIMERSFGYRIAATRDEYGHADVGTALVIALPLAVRALGYVGMLQHDDDLAMSSGVDLSPDEVDSLPEEFRELREMARHDFRSDGWRRPLGGRGLSDFDES